MRNTLPLYPESCAPCDLSKDGWESRHNLGHGKLCPPLPIFFVKINNNNNNNNNNKSLHECPFSCPNSTRKLKIKIDNNDELLKTIWELIMKDIILFIT